MEINDIIADLESGKDVILFSDTNFHGNSLKDSYIRDFPNHKELLSKIQIKHYYLLTMDNGFEMKGVENTSFYYHPDLIKKQGRLLEIIERLRPYLNYVEIIIKDGIIRVEVLDEKFGHRNYNKVGIDPFPKSSDVINASIAFNLVFELMLDLLKEEYDNEYPIF